MSTSAPSELAALRTARESQRAGDVAQAQSILRGKDADALTAYRLAERLKSSNEFGYARRLYGHIRRVGDYAALQTKASVAKVGQRHALCTYKDPDLPAADRFQWALKILDEVDNLKLTGAEQQESLGLRGAVHKRIWQQQGQFPDLVRSGGYYLQGYAMGPQTDQGYTGINAAFVLELLAREGAIEAARTGAGWDAVEAQMQRAQEIRQVLTKVLPDLPATAGNEWLRKDWWFYTTRAEAHFGLGDYEAGLAALREFNRAVGLPHERPRSSSSPRGSSSPRSPSSRP